MQDTHALSAEGGLRDYLRMARFDHVTKQVFILPGIALAILLRDVPLDWLALNVLLGFPAAIAIASANYVINEWLDRDFDAYHPEKSQRAAVQKVLNPAYVYLLYGLLAAMGLGLAAAINATFLTVAGLFLLAGLVYNVPPVRSKDRVYVDVVTEAINNPIRLSLGWAMVDPTTLPPVSLLFAFWFGGAFLMNSKRVAEFRDIVAASGAEVLGRYRRSFRYYSEARLSVANLVYALLCAFFTAIFLVKYRIEYILVFPLMTALFAEYYMLALRPNSVARKPEHLFRARPLMLLAGAAVAVFVFATFVNLPVLGRLTDHHFIDLNMQVVD